MLLTLGNNDFAPEVAMVLMVSELFMPDVFGSKQSLFAKNIPDLDAEENVFIVVAAVDENTDGKALIGIPNYELYLTADTVFSALGPILPEAYTGDIYLCATLVQSDSEPLKHFSETLAESLSSKFQKTQLWYAGAAGQDRLPSIGSKSWHKA